MTKTFLTSGSYIIRPILLSLLLFTLNLTFADQQQWIELAIANPTRPAFDRQRDVTRKPAEVLRFYDVRRGMTIVDVFSGDGYYTELLSHLVGDSGKIIAHNNQAYLNYVAKKIQARYTPGRLENVERLTAEANALSVPENSADMVFLILAYHDIYYSPNKGLWKPIDRDDFLNRLFLMLKPGGTLAVIDHEAEKGSPVTTGHKLHRIDPARVVKEVTNIGFVFQESANFLQNTTDDLTAHMYRPDLKGRTSRFVFKFTKPLVLQQQLVEDKKIP